MSKKIYINNDNCLDNNFINTLINDYKVIECQEGIFSFDFTLIKGKRTKRTLVINLEYEKLNQFFLKKMKKDLEEITRIKKI